MTKRAIKSWKDGRTAHFHCRLTPDEKYEIVSKAIKLNMSQADLIVLAVRKWKAGANKTKTVDQS